MSEARSGSGASQKPCPHGEAKPDSLNGGSNMRTLDFAPLYRATVGFDQIADLMDRVLTDTTTAPSYPPYNIEKTADDAWRISIAVAGFSDADLNVELRENALIVTAKKGQGRREAHLSAPGHCHARIRAQIRLGRPRACDRREPCRRHACTLILSAKFQRR